MAVTPLVFSVLILGKSYHKKDSARWILKNIWKRLSSVNCFVDKAGSLSTSIPHIRKEVRGGEVSKGTTVDDAELQAIAGKLLPHFQVFEGHFVFRPNTAAGRIGVFEINARFGGGFPLAHQAGGTFTNGLRAPWFA